MVFSRRRDQKTVRCLSNAVESVIFGITKFPPASQQQTETEIMDPSQTKHGEFSWNEILTTDPAAATKFYTQLFGWSTQDFPMPDFTYTVVKLKGAEQGQGGLMPIPSHAKGMPPAWFPYVTVD